MDSKLRRWELALMLGVALALILGAWLGGEQRSLADQVVRLHVIANSNKVGDQALKRVSAAIRDAVRSRDIVARFGGEEFMVLLTNISLEHARQTAERIRQKVYDLKIPHLFNESVATNVTISIGIAIFEDEDVEGALEKADKALYEAKHMGRNNILLSEEIQTA